MGEEYDVVIVGAGITGCGIARELARYDLRILVVDKEEDVCCGASKANNGMVHSGYEPKPGTLKAKLNVRGVELYPRWAAELDFKLVQTGSMVAAFSEEELPALEKFLERGKVNGVPGIEIISGDEARKKEPNLSPEIIAVLWTPSAGYVEVQQVVLALAENAVANGVRFLLGAEVTDVLVEGGRVQGVVTTRGTFRSRYVINAAGVYADKVAEMAGAREFTIHPRRGTLIVFDKREGKHLSCFIGAVPGEYTKGGGPMTTPDGNPLWGPSAIEVADKEDTAVSAEDLRQVIEKDGRFIPNFPTDTVITYFSGNRPATYTEDFFIEPSAKVHGFVNVAGIQSPGVASSPAIAEMVVGIMKEYEPLHERPDFNPYRKRFVPFRERSREEQAALIAADPRFGHIICRCEHVTEAEIVRAIHSAIPARNVDAVKRRTRAGMGRCQGGFCGPRVAAILARELGVPVTAVTKKGPGSELFAGRIEDLRLEKGAAK
ncbi:NAD(P)/FAD-dependent oxidoreductase [Gelria sp. Kuro-4]|uniref:NAD(P)/FAD-dependent oxidoreductase n=1 Tax=Gelria sp. Kuro-4 TaxID=2796927 RepID=UPI001BF09CA6|nr:NAD(P)/FAD-dependent oxidoreductase [Gelria sp. Kuro-4]BCV24654.1 FAD/NAD(P)-binding oxidoreductase [Gelria sp. Kuro-4]